MSTMIFEGDGKALEFPEDSLIVVIDDTGHEEFLDPNHRVFGLGGCAFLVKDYQRLIKNPWNFMCNKYFSEHQRPLHAVKVSRSCTKVQMEALKHFFEKFQFFRIAETASINVEIESPFTFINLMGASLLNRVLDISKHAEFERLIIIFEASERIESKVMASLSDKKLIRELDKKEIPIELAVMPKNPSFPALEVADFVIHTAGRQTRRWHKGDNGTNKDFESVFVNVQGFLTSFMETKSIKAINA